MRQDALTACGEIDCDQRIGGLLLFPCVALTRVVFANCDEPIAQRVLNRIGEAHPRQRRDRFRRAAFCNPINLLIIECATEDAAWPDAERATALLMDATAHIERRWRELFNPAIFTLTQERRASAVLWAALGPVDGSIVERGLFDRRRFTDDALCRDR